MPSDDPSRPSYAPGTPPGEPAAALETDYHIVEGGRLSVDAASLPKNEVITLGLALPDEAHGGELLPVRIVDVGGRRLEITATPLAGRNGGVRLEIDSDWLTPGRYMIEISTFEETPLALRRYVFELR